MKAPKRDALSPRERAFHLQEGSTLVPVTLGVPIYRIHSYEGT